MVISKSFDGTLQGHTRSLSHLQNLFLISVSQNISGLNSVAVKHISIHIIISSFRMFHIIFVISLIFIGHTSVFQRLTNKSINNSLLFLSKSVEHVLYGLFILGGISLGCISLGFLLCHVNILLFIFNLIGCFFSFWFLFFGFLCTTTGML